MANGEDSLEEVGQAFKKALRCPFCENRAHLLEGPLGAAKYSGWTRYECSGGHRFAVPSHRVEERIRPH